jgi:hypothetical protein
MKIGIKLSSILQLLAVCMLVIVGEVSGQYYYVNTYLGPNKAGFNKNAIVKIDIPNQRVIDSVEFNIEGGFNYKAPYSIFDDNGIEYLFTFLVNGLSGKNSDGGNYATTHFFIVDKVHFKLVGQDSLPHTQVTVIDSAKNGSFTLDALDDSLGWVYFTCLIKQGGTGLRPLERNLYGPKGKHYNQIGKYVEPICIGGRDNNQFYFDLVDGTLAVIFSTDSLGNIIKERIVGDKTQEVVAIGYNPDSNLIYVFIFKFYLETFHPPIASGDTIVNNLYIYNSTDFTPVDNIPLGPEPYFLVNDLGKADYYDGRFVYYFSAGEGGDAFLPAPLLIFDTRTNEATWLRVGWR